MWDEKRCFQPCNFTGYVEFHPSGEILGGGTMICADKYCGCKWVFFLFSPIPQWKILFLGWRTVLIEATPTCVPEGFVAVWRSKWFTSLTQHPSWETLADSHVWFIEMLNICWFQLLKCEDLWIFSPISDFKWVYGFWLNESFESFWGLNKSETERMVHPPGSLEFKNNDSGWANWQKL